MYICFLGVDIFLAYALKQGTPIRFLDASLPNEDKIVDGEDFQLNRWRCLETPDRASLGPLESEGLPGPGS